MSKHASGYLYRLLKSLTKAEKRYFKIFASRHTIGERNDSLVLFDAIDSMKEYDEKCFLGIFRQNKFQTRPAIAKARLYELTLKSLDAFYSDSSIDVEIRKLLHYAEILFKKSLYDECRKIISKAKKIGEKHQRFSALLDIRKWENRLIEKDSYAGLSFDEITESLDEELKILEELKYYSEFWYIKSRLLMMLNKQGKVRDNKEVAGFKKIIDNTLLKGKEQSLSYEARYLYYKIYSAYFFGIGDYEHAFRYLKKHIDLIEENAEVFNEEPNKYFAVLSNIIYVCTQLKKFKDVHKYLAKLKSLRSALEEEMTEDLGIKFFATSYSAELSSYIQSGRFDKALAIVPEIETGFAKYKSKINKVRAAFFYFNLSVVYFSCGNFSKALYWINQLLNDSSLDEHADFYCFAKIFNLIIHLEMGNNDLLPYAVKSTLRYFEKRNRIYRFESLFFDFINSIQKAKNSKEEFESYRHLHSELDSLSKDPFEKTVFEYFDFLKWAESKRISAGKNQKMHSR